MKTRAALLSLCAALSACARPSDRPAPAPSPAPIASDVTAARGVRDAGGAARPGPSAAPATVRAAVTGASADPPLREFDRTLPVPRWSGQGELSLTLPAGDGPVAGTLRAGDLSLRVRGFRAGDTVRGSLEPESVDDGGAFVWRGMLDLRAEGGALRGTWSVSAHGGRFARAGVVGGR